MGIWLRKFKYGKFLKGLASTILCFMMIAVAEMVFYQNETSNYFAWAYSTYESSYYDTIAFQQIYIPKAGLVRDWIVRYSDPLIFTSQGVTGKEVEYYKQTAKGLEIQEEAKQGSINKGEFIERRIKEEIIKDRKAYFEKLQEELLTKDKSFIFFAQDTTTGEVVTNVQYYNGKNEGNIISDMMKKPAYLVGNAKGYTYNDGSRIYDFSYYDYTDNTMSTMSDAQANRYKIYTAIDETKIDQVDSNDRFSIEKQKFERMKEVGDILKAILLVMLLLGLIAGLYLAFAAGKGYDATKIHLNRLDKMWLEIQVILLFIIEFVLMNMALEEKNAAISIRAIRGIISEPIYYSIGIDTIVLYTIVALGTILAIFFGVSIIKRIKARSLLKTTFAYSVYDFLRKVLFHEKTLSVGVTVGTSLYIMFNIILSVAFSFCRSFIIFFFLISLNILVMIAMIIFAVDYQKIVSGAKHIADGDLGYKIVPASIFPISTEMAQTVNNIGEGLERAAASALKSERFKTELITNVSHDLKTPLTSIISYIELLQQEEIENEEARKYIDILAERSERLKCLIEDLIEASKATTGNLSIDMGVIQLDELVKQIIGEYSDKIEEQGLDIVYSRMQETSILADGKHMWRVVENLVSNIIKYTMQTTRVYIDVFIQDGYGILTMKNVSKEPLNVDPAELTKRFVRGDESRTEEGFGLGLAIADSLVQLQKGKFEISIDGDLFKVCIKIPITHNDKM